jgi:uncharacterized membrane protein
MAAKKRSASSGGSGRPGSGGTRHAPGSGRSGSNGTRQRFPTPGSPTAKPTGNGAASAKSRSAGNGAAKGQPATAAQSARGSAAAAASPASAPASGLVGRIFGPFRTVGPVPLITFVLSLYALGASVYLTIAHYDTSVTLVCSDKGLVNCTAVTTSPQSMVFGIFPVAVIGLAYYVFMTALNTPWAWQLQQSGSDKVSMIIRYTRLAAIVAGMGFVLYLIYAELIQIRAICLWCTSVHVATFLIFAVIVFYSSLSPGGKVQPRKG